MAQLPASQDAGFRSATERQVEALIRKTPYHSLRLPDGSTIPGLIGIAALEQRIRSFPIPESLAGRRVLDVGAASGWNSFEMARRGAQVTAIDCVEFEEFRVVQSLYTPKVDYRIMDIDELDPARIGTFDYTLFFGVLYHLRHPLLSLEKICALTKETAFVESFVSDREGARSDACTLEFYETDELGGQIDNWFGPTANCLTALCRSAGFVRVQLEYMTDTRAGVTCHRRWEPEPDTSDIDAAWLYSAVNNRTDNIYFHRNKDEYLCIYFRSQETDLQRERLRIEIDGYGINALTVHRNKEDEWQVNARLPPGLAVGEHVVRLRTDTTRFGNAFSIQLLDSESVPAIARVAEQGAADGQAPEIYLLENSLDRSDIFHGYRAERLCCRFRTSERDLSVTTVFALFDEQSAEPVSFLTDLGNGNWQVNLVLAGDLADGNHRIQVRTIGSVWSDPVAFLFRSDTSIL